MRLFNRDAPGVEWVEDPAATVPLNAPTATDSPFPTTCTACGGDLGIDGYCLQCGQKARTLRDHYELAPADWLVDLDCP